MALKAALLKDLERQVPEFTNELLPSTNGKIDFIDAQIEGMQKQAYRALVDLEVAREFAASKDPEANALAQRRFEEVTGQLKAIKPTLKVLEGIKAELEAAEAAEAEAQTDGQAE